MTRTQQVFLAGSATACVLLALLVVLLLNLPLPLIAPVSVVLMLAVQATVEIIGHRSDRRNT